MSKVGDQGRGDEQFQSAHHRTSDSESSMSSFMDGNLNQVSLDVNTLRADNRMLKNQVRTLQNDLQAEQDTVSTLRRKLTSIERDRLEAVSKANEDVSRLDSELTRLRAQLEKGEAVRQNLEYELAKAKRDLGIEKRNFHERENSSAEVMESLKQKQSELSRQVEMLLNEMDTAQSVLKKEEELTRTAVSQRDTALASLQSQREAAETQRAQMEAAMHQKDIVLREAEDRVSELEDECRQQTDSLRAQCGETELCREREDRLKQELQAAVSRVKSLEESIEAERAAHLESKFNSEIIQLRIRDLESAIELEKAAKTDAISAKEKLRKQIRDLQKVYEDERKNGQLQGERIKEAEQEYAGLTKQLQADLSDKREIINRLSSELDNHAREFSDLKAELNKAKKRQIYLEETYSGCMKELQLLLDNFRLDTSSSCNKAKPSGKTGPPTALANRRAAQAQSSSIPKADAKKAGVAPAVIMESLRHTLIAYKRKCDDLSAEVLKMSAQYEVSSKENARYKVQAIAKEKALENSKKSAKKSSDEVSKLQESKRELQGTVKELKAQLDNMKHLHERAEKDLQEKHDQVVLEYLCGLYHQMLLALPHDLPQQLPYNFKQLSVLLSEQTSRLITALKGNTYKLQDLECSCGKKEEVIGSMQKAHEEQLQKLARLAEGRDEQWQQQKAEMEAHYAQLLKEVQDRQQQTQALADKGWEQLRVTGSLQQGLDKECQELQQSLIQVQKEHDTLLTTCALLCGSLYPLYSRNITLARERALLLEQWSTLDTFKSQVQHLVCELSPEQQLSSPPPPPPRRGRPALTFRAAAVAVMAANRLLHLASNTACMFVLRDALPGVAGMAVYAGRMMEDDTGTQRDSVLHWLTSADLKVTVMTCVAELQTVLQDAREGESVDQQVIVREARKCFHRLLHQLPASFPDIPTAPHSALTERASLLRLLNFGLTRTLNKTQEGQVAGTVDPYESSQATLGKLQSHVMELAGRLHGAEVERLDLRSQVTRLLAEKKEWAKTGMVPDDIEIMQKEVENSVSREKFERICMELSDALKREQQEQQLLSEQSQQIQRLSSRIDSQVRDGSQKEHTLTEAVAGLTEAKMELKKQEQRLRNLQRQLQQGDGEKKILSENIADAEKALRTAARDREALEEYVNSIERALRKVQFELTQAPMSSAVDYTALLSPDVLPCNMSKAGAELLVCQRLVAAFVDTHRQVCNRMEACQSEIQAQKEHIAILKQELNAACKREYNDEFDKPGGLYQQALIRDGTLVGHEGQHADRDERFYPLIEDLSSSSYSAPALTDPPKIRPATSSGAPVAVASKKANQNRQKQGKTGKAK